MRDFSQDHRWLSINTATVRRQRGVDWPLLGILDACAARGIRAVSPWRDQVAAAGLAATARTIKAHGLELSGYCRGGMFTYTDAASRQAVRDDNRRALDEACLLGAPCLVLV
ncbi:MAG TPA: sugar phosphate isomerase/epimerase, partial [Burkholderiaceae bacterium]|nr:sugar phosphate isomerase/epimerase [Burkholderiaceae bacterium]